MATEPSAARVPDPLDPMCVYCEIRLSEHEEITPWCEEVEADADE